LACLFLFILNQCGASIHLPQSQEGTSRWEPRSIALLGNKAILEGDGVKTWAKEYKSKPKETLPLFPSDHFWIVLELGAPTADVMEDDDDDRGFKTFNPLVGEAR
jgi:hypothetical protein